MGLKIYGIGAAQNKDSAGETILIENIDTRFLTGIRDEHDDDDFFHKLGGVTFSKKIFRKEDCENDTQLRAWNYAKVPFLYVEGELLDDVNHPNAQSAAAWIRYSQRADTPGDVGFSIDGRISERRDVNGNITEDKKMGKILSQAIAFDVALTVKPCNPKCKLWMFNDLTKSDRHMVAPKGYLEALKKSVGGPSIREVNDYYYLYHKTELLKKSVSDYFDSVSALRCNKCGNTVRVFVSGELPNRCAKCDSSYTISDLWNVANKGKK